MRHPEGRSAASQCVHRLGGLTTVPSPLDWTPPPRHSERNEVESKNLPRFEKEEGTRSFGTRLSPRLRMTRSLGFLRWLVGVRRLGRFGPMWASAPTVGPYSVTVGAVINRPGSRRVPSTGRWIRTGTWRAINDRPYGGDGTNFGLPPRHPKTCVILSGTKWSRRIFYVSKRKKVQDPSARGCRRCSG